MSKNSILFQDIQKLKTNQLKNLTKIWEIHSIKYTKNDLYSLYEVLKKDFYIKNVLVKLNELQSSIYAAIINSDNFVLKLGEISRKTKIPANNIEIELKTLVNCQLIYQRKDRERLTSNLDRYYAYEEIAKIVVSQNGHLALQDSKIFSMNVYSSQKPPVSKMNQETTIEKNQITTSKTSKENFQHKINSLNDIEKNILAKIYMDGGMILYGNLKQLIVFQGNRKNYEKILFRFLQFNLLVDVCFFEDGFHRVFIIPQKLSNHLNKFPIFVKIKGIARRKDAYKYNNQLDFFLNIKLLISYINRKGLSLAKSERIKQIDQKKTEKALLNIDMNLFPEKSYIYKVDIVLPILKLLEVVDVKNGNIVLIENFEEILKEDIFVLVETVLQKLKEVKKKKQNSSTKITVFEPVEVPFYQNSIFRQCIKKIREYNCINLNTLLFILIRENLILSETFSIKNFNEDIINTKKEIMSAIFYLNSFGMIDVEYPARDISFSELGLHYLFQEKDLDNSIQKGSIIINPDSSLIAFSDRISIYGLHLLKVFCELIDFDGVYKFQLTQNSYQNGLLLHYNSKEFLDFLNHSVKGTIPQNLLFSVEEWQQVPIIDIIENCVLIKSNDKTSIQSLVSKVKNKKISIEQINDNIILIDRKSVDNVIKYAETLDLIIKLVRK